MRTCITEYALAVTLSLAASMAEAAWRGDGTGIFASANPPLTWSMSENILWKTKLPSWSNAGVAIHDKLLFVCAEPHTLICVNADNGAILWQQDSPAELTFSAAEMREWEQALKQHDVLKRTATELQDVRRKRLGQPQQVLLEAQEQQLSNTVAKLESELATMLSPPVAAGHPETGATSPTPVVDVGRKCVYAFFTTGVVTAFDFTGQRLWVTGLPMAASKYGHTSSPVLTKRRLIISHGPVSALDPDTGKTVWSVKSEVRMGTPVLTDINDTSVVITPGGLCLRTADGGLVCDNLPTPEFSSPVVHKGIAYYVGIDDNKAVAYGLPRRTFSRSAAAKLWETPLQKGHYYASPVLLDGTLFGVRQSGRMVSLDAKTGELQKEQLFDEMHLRFGQIYAPLAVAGNRLYVFSDNGSVLVLQPTKAFKELGINRIEKLRSGPMFDGNRIYLRGMRHLLCIGNT